MKININHTSFRLRDDTEAIEETPGAVKFLEDHNVPFTFYIQPGNTMIAGKFKEKNMLQWHESESTVDVSCNSVDELIALAEKYDAVFKINSHGVSVDFK